MTYLQLCYISTMRAPVGPAECEDILAVSRRNNGRDGITGLLVVGTTRFLQLLEGPPSAVRAAYARIKADPRHYAAVVVSERQVEERDCPDWAMGYVPGGADKRAELQALVERLAAPIANKNVRAQFTGFAALQAA
ncbi:BLUF domain-containing protein [Sphingomonas piscis]|uniref:BLUF domain-containing protein n=1 Tax=Sphingomonas piscis TaxID=2714943 RepID=UPI001FED1D07|nr:BLUF domain-containing protein [Sphingomonas piscis]